MLIGLQSPDDAAIWRLDESRGLVLTTDFFTPVVDDPRDYGRIAAANSLSDIYAMGGTPFLALNIAALPPDLDPDISSQIFLGGAEVARQAGVVVAGGHTIQDKEPKYGMVTAGFVELDEIITKAGAKPGDRLYLTKPLGFGTITTALKRQRAEDADVAEAVRWMTQLNRAASAAARKCGVRGGTDITGYAFIGHALEMIQKGGMGMCVEFDRIPLLDNALKYARELIFPGGAYDNLNYFKDEVVFRKDIPEYMRLMLFDPQTSGGLLLAVPIAKAAEFELMMKSDNNQYWSIGDITDGRGITIY